MVVMDIEAFARHESMLHLGGNLAAAEESRLNGKNGYTIDEGSDMMKATVQEALDGQRR
ncbi:MAG: hypothetical protein DDT32_01643 [Syntrophomonadaceae bacterium]|nr:hypothetical protein [Bacillota bacterium]MBT9147877.1 hypothetical protein [Bacillota bacterium]